MIIGQLSTDLRHITFFFFKKKSFQCINKGCTANKWQKKKLKLQKLFYMCASEWCSIIVVLRHLLGVFQLRIVTVTWFVRNENTFLMNFCCLFAGNRKWDDIINAACKTAITCPSSKILSLFYCIVLAIGSESNIKYKCPKIKCQKIVFMVY